MQVNKSFVPPAATPKRKARTTDDMSCTPGETNNLTPPPAKTDATVFQQYKQQVDSLKSRKCQVCNIIHSQWLLKCVELCSTCGDNDHFYKQCNNPKRVLRNHKKKSFRFCYRCWAASHPEKKCTDYSLKQLCFYGIDKSKKSEKQEIWSKILQTNEARYEFALEVMKQL